MNVRDLGAKGDGTNDDTDGAPKGHRRASRSLFALRFLRRARHAETAPDTVMIGLHPGATQIILPDDTPGYQGVGAPKALIEAPKGGSNILIGLGLYTSGANPRAVAALWKAGAGSHDERRPFSRGPWHA